MTYSLIIWLRAYYLNTIKLIIIENVLSTTFFDGFAIL